MKMIEYFIEKINEDSNVKISLKFHSDTWKIQVVTVRECGFEHSECFDSLKDVEIYLRGFYDAYPFN